MSLGGYMHSKLFVSFLLTSILSSPAFALTLEPVPEPQLDSLPIDTSGPDVPCDEIEARLTAYQVMARQHDSQVVDFLMSIGTGAAKWNEEISALKSEACLSTPDEGFELLDLTASATRDRAAQMAENRDFLSALLAPVIDAVPACVNVPVSSQASAGQALACGEIADQMQDYSGKLLLHESANNAFLGDVSLRLNTLHATLTQYDCAELQDGSLDVLLDAANKVDTLTNTAYDNAEKLANEFDRLSVSLSYCAPAE